VLGGGIVGGSIAYHVAKAQRALAAAGGDMIAADAVHGAAGGAGAGVSVTLLEGQTCGSGASGLSAGTLWDGGPGALHNGDVIASLCHGTVSILREIEALGFDCALRLPGSLTIATTDAEETFLRAKYEGQARAGLAVAYLATNAEVRALEPALGPAVRAAILTPGSGHVSPGIAAAAFGEAAASLGAMVHEGSRVVALARVPCSTHGEAAAPRRNGQGAPRPSNLPPARYAATTAAGDVYLASSVVLAAGTGIPALARSLGVADVPAITPVKGQIWAVAQPANTLRHVVFTVSGPAAWGKDSGRRDDKGIPAFCTDGYRVRHTYGRQCVDGTLLFGWGREPCREGDYTVDEAAVQAGYDFVGGFLPLLTTTRRDGAWAGVMPFSADGQPIVGSLGAEGKGLWVAGGFGPHGIMEGPMAGKWLAYRVVGHADAQTKALPAATEGALHPRRFGPGTRQQAWGQD